MAATIPNQSKRRRSGAPWSLGLLALLFVFWKYVGGAGGWFPGTGDGADRNDRGASRPAGARADSRTTVRRDLISRFASPAVAGPAEAAPRIEARATVAPARAAASGRHEVKLSIMGMMGKETARGRIEVLPDSRTGASAPVETYPIVGGTATIPEAPAGKVVRVRIVPEDGPPVIGSFQVAQGEQTVAIDKAVVTGRAVFPGGEVASDLVLVARAFFLGTRQDEPREFRTTADGSFRLEIPSGREVLLEIRPKDAVKGADIAPLVFQKEALEPGTTWNLEPDPMTFQHEVTLAEGVVQDGKGNLVPNASVFALPTRHATRELAARSDANGHFALKGPPEIEAFDVFAATENDAASIAGPTPKGATDLKLVLAPAGRIEGFIRSPTPLLNPLLRVELLTGRENLFVSTHVNPEGTFDFPHVPAGTHWKLAVVGPDGRTAVPGSITVPEGGASDAASLKSIAIESRFAPSRLRLMDSSGAPIPDAWVMLEITNDARFRAKTDRDGVAEVLFAPGADGAVTLNVEAPGFATHRGAWDGKSAITLRRARAESAESR